MASANRLREGQRGFTEATVVAYDHSHWWGERTGADTCKQPKFVPALSLTLRNMGIEVNFAAVLKLVTGVLNRVKYVPNSRMGANFEEMCYTWQLGMDIPTHSMSIKVEGA